MGAAGCWAAHRCDHAWPRSRAGPHATPVGDSGDAGRVCGVVARVLGALCRRIRGRVRRLLRPRADPWHPAHQSVLDPCQRHLRPASRQTAVRVHRRRREPRRCHRRRHYRGRGRPRRHGEPAARRRGGDDPLPRAGALHHQRGGEDEVRGRRGRGGGGRRRGDPTTSGVSASAAHRRHDRLCRHGRGDHRAAAQHGGRDTTRAGRRRHHPVPRPDHRLPVAGGIPHPDLVDKPDSQPARHWLRAADPARGSRHDSDRHAPQRQPLATGVRARARHVAALHRRQDDSGDSVPSVAGVPEVSARNRSSM